MRTKIDWTGHLSEMHFREEEDICPSPSPSLPTISPDEEERFREETAWMFTS